MEEDSKRFEREGGDLRKGRIGDSEEAFQEERGHARG